MGRSKSFALRALIIAGALILVGGVAYASIPDAGGVIHGCRKNSDGSIRVVDSDLGQTCASGWTALNWSQTGPPGATGPAGANGVSGFEIKIQTAVVPTGPRGPDAGAFVLCTQGKQALGGGGTATRPDEVLHESKPIDFYTSGAADGWKVAFRQLDPDDSGFTITVWALCASVS